MADPFRRQVFHEDDMRSFYSISSCMTLQNGRNYCRRVSKQLKQSSFSCITNIKQQNFNKQAKNSHWSCSFTGWMETPVRLFLRPLSKQGQKYMKVFFQLWASMPALLRAQSPSLYSLAKSKLQLNTVYWKTSNCTVL